MNRLAPVLGVIALVSTLLGPAKAAPLQRETNVDVTVSVSGNIEGISAEDVEDLAEHLLEQASIAVTDEDGPDTIVLHLEIVVDDDGEGYEIHFAAAGWSDSVDIDSFDELDEILTTEIHEFVEVVEDEEGEETP